MFIMGQTTPEENPFFAWMSSYSYEAFNQMVKSTTAEGVIENKYNDEGLRTEKTLDGALTRYLYIEDQPVLEVDQYGREQAQNIMGTNLISRIVDDSTEMYYLYNGHADVTELVTPQGDITAEYTYDAFGVPKTTTGTADNPFRYAGYQYDESGLYYLNSRMYNPVIARFMQEDTYRGELNDPLSLKLYAYCNNNPLIYSDPTGHGLKKLIEKAATKVGSALKTVVKKIGNSGSSTAKAYTSTANNLITAGSNAYDQKNNTTVTVTPPPTPTPTTSAKKETNVVTVSPSVPVRVTLPASLGGGEVTGYISGGKTTIPGYGKLPEGTIVHTQKGDYRVDGGVGVPNNETGGTLTSGTGNSQNNNSSSSRWQNYHESSKNLALSIGLPNEYAEAYANAATGIISGAIVGGIVSEAAKTISVLKKVIESGTTSSREATNPYELLNKNNIPQTLTDNEIAAANNANLQMALQDRGMVQQVAKTLKMTPEERWDFGDYVEAYKQANGIPNNATLSWKELIKLGKEFKGGE